jgi:lysine 2,3-aminomutase
MKFDTKKQKRLARVISAKKNSYSRWSDYKWQLKHSVREIDTFEKLTGIKFSRKEKDRMKKTLQKFPLSITPYYLSLINKKNYTNDPIYKQSFPDPRELDVFISDIEDPLAEDKDSPVKGVVHRYPDRVLFDMVTKCAMYCRHCTRKRKVGDKDSFLSKKTLQKGIDYIRETESVRDVLISGGDPLMLSDQYLEWILSQIKAIPHVEVIRVGTRMPVVLPYRITDNLVAILKKYQPLWLNTQFNHPREMTISARRVLKKLADNGIPLGNQTVLLAGVNDCPRIMKKLMHKLVQNRVRPYYLYQCDLSEGLSHFRTPVSKGIEIMESLIGHTSGFAIPTYVVDAPGGGGKIPVMPNYLISWSTNKVILRNYEGVITSYKEPDSYEAHFCDRKCETCKLQLNLAGAKEKKSVGIGKLMDDYDSAISLTPISNERFKRRKKRRTIR